LDHLWIGRQVWERIYAGLKSNPYMEHWTLCDCLFYGGVKPVMIEHLKSNKLASNQQVCILELLSHSHTFTPTEIHQLLCGSMLQHVTLDLRPWVANQVTELFATLLQGLLASSDALDTLNCSKGLGKRVAADKPTLDKA
jgi:hypothetical protein